MAWAEALSITIEHIQPGQPQQNAYVERYNRTVRHEGWTSTSSRPSRKRRISPRNGYGRIITIGPTWVSAASCLPRN